ncbi:MAG: DUF2516 family protein [Actinomycetota bacterium]|jgi:uncharacterized membrane protein YeiB|nr:DUF2516 family protein [Actinomycetota bacterium]
MSVSFETLNVVMGYLFVAIKMWAFVDAVTQKKEVFAAVGKQSKLFWSSLLGISVLSQFISVWTGGSNYGLLQIVGLILSIVYLVDQRPKMNEIRGK